MKTPLPLLVFLFALLAGSALAQQAADGTQVGAPLPGPGSPAMTAPVSKPGPNKSSVTLTAIDSKSIATVSHQNWNDNRLRAYWNNTTMGYVDGLLKFDMSSIPNGSFITSMTLRVYHEAGPSGNPVGNPEVIIFRSGYDGWSRANSADTHPGVYEILTTVYTGFSSADLAPVDFVIDVDAVDWVDDLRDDTLTLCTRNTAGAVGRYSFVYFYGSDSSPAPPELIIEYNGGLQLSLNNLVAGSTASVDISYAQPGATCYVGWSQTGAGPTWVNTPWGAFSVHLSNPINNMSPMIADGAGNASASVFVPPAAIGLTIYAHALVKSTSGTALSNSVAKVIQ